MIGCVTRRGSSPVFVGRASELARLDDAYHRADTGHPSMILVAGDAGVGKTRLVTEFASRVTAAGARVITGGCLDLGEGGLPYAPFIEALRAVVRTQSDTDPPHIVRQAKSLLATLVPEVAPSDDPSRYPDVGQGPNRRARLFDAMIDTLGSLATERSSVLIIEDLQWADGSTRDLLRFLVRNLRDERTAIVATVRSDDLHRRHPLMPLLSELERHENVERIEVRPFRRAELAAQLTGILGSTPSAATVDELLRRSDGLPFYVEELAARTDGDGSPIPATLRDILEVRLAALSPETLALVSSAAVIGARFELDQLGAMTGRTDAQMLSQIREAVEHRIVVDVTDAGTPTFEFRHSLLREAAYGELLATERLQMHARLADFLEGKLRESAVADPSLLAGFAVHADQAGDRSRALEASVRAMHATADATAFREALVHAERALTLWSQVGDPEAAAGLRHDELLATAGRVAADAGEARRALALLQAAVDEPAAPRDPDDLTRLITDLWMVAFESFDVDARAGLVTQLTQLVDGLPASSLKVSALIEIGWERWADGQNHESVVAAKAAMEVARSIGDDRAWGIAASALAMALADLGRLARAVALVDEIQATEPALDGTIWTSWAVVDRANVLYAVGRFEDAVRISLDAVAAARRYGTEDRIVRWVAPIDSLFELGRYDEVEAIARDALATAVSANPFLGIDGPRIGLRIIRGDLVAARQILSGRASRPADWRPWELGPLTQLARAEGRFDEVVGYMDEVARVWQGHDLDGVIWTVMVAAIGAAADEAARRRLRRQVDEAAMIAETAISWLDRLRALVARLRADGGAGGFCEAALATAEAEVMRARALDDAAPWEGAVAAWSALRHPYETAYARLRLAQVVLDHGGDRSLATEVLRDAHETSIRLDARPLRREIESLSGRARVDLVVSEGDLDKTGNAPSLTSRERDVLRLVAQGHTNREIGTQLFISEKTVSVHVSNAMAKLGSLSRYEAAGAAERLGLL